MAASCFSSFVEGDGIARSILVILFLTTIGCFSYTWGYYEGIHNSQAGPLVERSVRHFTEALANETVSHLSAVDSGVASAGLAKETGPTGGEGSARKLETTEQPHYYASHAASVTDEGARAGSNGLHGKLRLGSANHEEEK
eukprot:gene10487-8453_t